MATDKHSGAPDTGSDCAGNQMNELYDALALLDAAADRIDAAASPAADDSMHSTLRLVHMARNRVDRAIDWLDRLKGDATGAHHG